jgi:hypothetical protein
MNLTIESLITVLRPLVVELESVLPRLILEGAALPTRPVPKLQMNADGSGEQRIEEDLDAFRVRHDAMFALEQSGSLRTAELIIARALGVEAAANSADAASKWTPEREVVNVFLELYITAVYGAGAHTKPASPFDDAADTALAEEAARLQAFLSADQLTSAYIVMASGFTIPEESLRVDTDLEIVPFSTQWRDQLWAAAGWGSLATQPLQFHDFFDVTHAISVTVTAKPDGWSLARWGEAQRKCQRLRTALLLCGARSVMLGVSWISHDERFGPYLARQRAGNGILSRPSRAQAAGRTELTADQAGELPRVYAQLADTPEDGVFALALRRLLSSSERNSAEDRLIDCWVAFEALFAPDLGSEMSYRASLRIARYVGADIDERRTTFDGLRNAYAWRSQVVHGSEPSDKELRKLGSLNDAVAISEDTLRRALRKWLLSPPANITEIDHLLLE